MPRASGDRDSRDSSSGDSSSGDSRGLRTAAAGLRARGRIFWLAPLAVLLVASLGYWAYSSVERSQKQQRKEELSALLRASSEGVTSWLAAKEAEAAAVATHSAVVGAAAALHETGGGAARPNALSEHEAQQRLRDQMSLLLSGTTFQRFRLVEPEGVVLASSDPAEIGQPTAKVPGPSSGWATTQGVRLWMPYGSRSGAVRMAVSASIAPEGRQLATLLLVFDPAREFYAILSAARSGSTGETYAFDRAGRLISPSRFDEALRAGGQLGPEAPAAELELELRDPDTATPEAPRSSRPFTLAVKRALAEHGDGIDVDGYRDYRGVEVIGAWTWLSRYEVGLITEKDASEAFALRDTVRRALGLLVLALALVMGGLVALTHVTALLQRRSRNAERQLEQLGQYQLKEKLGEGGMGAVYCGQHLMLRRPTAIKLLKLDGDDGKAALMRFEREVRITSQLTHPNTIAIYDYGVTPDGTFYYAMELLDGLDLEALVRRSGPMPAARVIHLLLQACGSLAEAHAAGLIHRDVKPANMIVGSRGGVWDTLKVLDFGLVKEMRRESDSGDSATLIGTPAFMAPEVLKDSERASPATDVYSLGASAYCLLTGRHMFDEEDPMRFMVAHLTEEPRPPSVLVRGVPADLEAVILRCLEKEPEQRYPGMGALAQALEACVDHGRWTHDDARAFWEEHGARLREAAPPRAARPLSVTIDPRELKRRAGLQES
jgi:tRNA A-37 threonylcarbamoyl transferase component Bud32